MWSRTLLTFLVEALEVPDDTLGNKVRHNRPANKRLEGEAFRSQRLQHLGGTGRKFTVVGGIGSSPPPMVVSKRSTFSLASPNIT